MFHQPHRPGAPLKSLTRKRTHSLGNTSALKVNFTVGTLRPYTPPNPGVDSPAQLARGTGRAVTRTEGPGDDGGCPGKLGFSEAWAHHHVHAGSPVRDSSRHSCSSRRCPSSPVTRHWGSTSPGPEYPTLLVGRARSWLPEASTVAHLGRAQGPRKGSQGQNRISGAASPVADMRGLGRLV